MNQARYRLMDAALGFDSFRNQEELDELYLAAIAFAEDLGYEKPEKQEQEVKYRSYDLIGAVYEGYMWQCKDCGRKVVGDKHNNLPIHECKPHWSTPPYQNTMTLEYRLNPNPMENDR